MAVSATPTEEADLVASSLLRLADGISAVVQSARENRERSDGVNDFLSFENKTGIKKLFAVSTLYAECMSRLGLTSRKQLEALCQRQLKAEEKAGEETECVVERLFSAEDSFTEFVDEMEQQLNLVEDRQRPQNVLGVGDCIPLEHKLLSVSSREQVPIKSVLEGSPFSLLVLMRHFG